MSFPVAWPAFADSTSGKCGNENCKASCIGEGGSIPVVPNAPSCCEGLTLIRPKDPQLLGSKGICTSKCGNGICDPETETAYNCPRDCDNPGNPFSDKIWDKYDYPVDAPGWEGTDWYNAQIMKKHEGSAYRMYLYRFMKKGRPVYVGWFDCFNVQQCSMMRVYTGVELNFDQDTKQIRITKAVLKHQKEKAVFETETKTAGEGKVIIFLQEVPVFVETK